MNRVEKEHELRRKLAAVAAFARGATCVPADEMEEIIDTHVEITLRKAGLEARLQPAPAKVTPPAIENHLTQLERLTVQAAAPTTPPANGNGKSLTVSTKASRNARVRNERFAAIETRRFVGQTEPIVHWVEAEGCTVCGRNYGQTHERNCAAAVVI